MAEERISIHVVGDADDGQRAVKETRKEVKGLSGDTAELSGAWRDANGRLRDSRGRFVAVGAAARAAGDDVERAGAKVDRSSRRMNAGFGSARGGSEGLHGSLLRLKLIGAALSFGPAISGLSALTSQLIATAGAVGPAAGGLAAAPSVLSAVIQGLGTVGLASGGVGDAIKASLDVQTSASDDATAALGRQEDQINRVRTAGQSLKQAKEAEHRAEDDLTLAREQGRRALEDMRAETERAAEDEEAMVIAKRRAREELNRVLADPNASDLDELEAENRLAKAETDLRDIRTQARRARRDFAKVEQGGPEKMPQVLAATQALSDAQDRATEASRDLSTAQRESRESAAQTSTAVDKEAQALAELSPAAREFVATVVALKPAWDDLQATAAEGLFPGVERGLKDAERLMPLVDRLVGATARTIGNDVAKAGEQLGSAGWQRDLELLGNRNVETLDRMGDGSLYLASAFRHVMVEADPLLDWITASVTAWAKATDEEAKHARQTGELAEFFDDSRFALEHLVSITGNVGSAMANIFSAGKDDGQDFLVTLDRLTGRFDRWTESVEGEHALREWFHDGRDVMEAVGEEIGRVVDRVQELEAQGKSSGDALIVALSEAFARALSESVEHLASRAPDLAEGFISGFLAADAWGRLAIGAWLLTRFGGLGAFATLGNRTGSAFGVGFGTSAATTAGVGLRAGLLTAIRGMGPGLAITLAAVFGPELAKLMEDPVPGAGGSWSNPSGYLSDLIGNNDDSGGLTPAESDEDFRILARGARTGELSMADLNAELDRYSMDEMPKAARAALRLQSILGRKIDMSVFKNPDEADRQIKQLNAGISSLAKGSGVTMDTVRREMRNNWRDIKSIFVDGSQESKDAMARNIRAGIRAIDGSMRDGTISTKAGMAEILRLTRRNTGASKEATSKNFDAAADAIEHAMDRGVIAAKRGTGMLRNLVATELKMYGIDPKKALHISKQTTNSADAFYLAGHGTFKARGGLTGAGAGLHQIGRAGDAGPDNILANIAGQNVMVGSGEVAAVFNRHQLPEINARLADVGGLPGFFNTYDKPHYLARGGIVSNYAGGGIVGVPGEPGTSIDRRILADVVGIRNKYALDVGDGYAASGHAADGEHPLGLAIDAYPGPKGSWDRVDQLARWAEPSQNNPRFPFRWVGYDGDANHGSGNHIHLSWDHGPGNPAAWVKTLGGKIVGSTSSDLQRILVDGPDSPWKSIVQGSLDQTWKAAKKRLDDMLTTSVGGAEGMESMPDMEVTGSGAGLMRKISKQHGWNFADWWEIDRRESGHGTNLANPTSTARLRGQFLDFNYGKYGPGSDPGQDPSMEQQIWSMARYIKERYGNPTAAREFHDANNWYARGGIVGMVGDSLGVGTAPHLRGMLGGKLNANVVTGRSSSSGVAALQSMLGGNVDQFVFDLGTNDGSAGDVASSLKRADKMTGDRTIHALTVNGPQAAAKNAVLRSLAGGDINLVNWAGKDAGLLAGDGIHATPAGYQKRAGLLAAAIQAAQTTDSGGAPGQGPVGAGMPSGSEIRDQERAVAKLRRRQKAKPSKRTKRDLAEARERLHGLRQRRKAMRRREKARFGRREQLAGAGLDPALIAAVEAADRAIEDKGAIYDIDESNFRADDVLTQPELDKLVSEKLTVRNLVGGDTFGAGGLAALLGTQVLPNVLGKIGKLEGRISKWRDRVKGNLKAIKAKQKEARELRERISKLRTSIRKIDGKKNPTKADMADRSRWAGELDRKQRRLGILTEREIPSLQRDNVSLVGSDGSLSSPSSGSVLARAGDTMDDLTRRRDDYQDRMRPGGLLSEWTANNLAVVALQREGASGQGDNADLRASLAQQRADQLQQAFNVSQAQFATLRGFAGSLGRMPFVGSFDKGGVVSETGLAMVHKDERYLGVQHGSGPPPIQVMMSADLAAHWRAIRGEMRAVILNEAAPIVSQQLGQRSRVMAGAPGGR